MSYSYLRILLFVCILLWLFIWTQSHYIERFLRDMSYRYHHERYPFWKNNVNKQQLTPFRVVPTRVCLVTLEDRPSTYLKHHNNNMENYIRYQNKLDKGEQYTYLHKPKCDCSIKHKHNPYWCKLFIVQELLETAAYDYVVWLDSDTIIVDPKKSLAQLLRSYENHIFCTTDFGEHYTICAGVFAFRNSPIGKNAIRALTDFYNSQDFQDMCITSEHKLKGIWAQTCYEQGAMNNILYKRFKPFVTILGNEWASNTVECDGEFIIHLFDTPSEEREECFKKYTKYNFF